jgi:hypothetical protein
MLIELAVGLVVIPLVASFSLGADLGDVDVEVADRIALDGLLGGFVADDLGQVADPVAPKATVQRRPRQMRNRRL